MDLRKLFHPRHMHTFQVIAFTGLVMTALAQLVLSVLKKEIPNFEWLYLCWLALYVFGLFRNIYGKPNHHDHHH